jgi:hypothetical protein
MHAERLALCDGKKDQHMEGKNAETRSRESSLVVNLMNCLLREVQ